MAGKYFLFPEDDIDKELESTTNSLKLNTESTASQSGSVSNFNRKIWTVINNRNYRISESYIRLVSKDGFEFFMRKEYVFVSNTLKAIIKGQGSFIMQQQRVIHLPNISGHILDKLCTYFLYKLHNSACYSTIPDFPISDDMALELLVAAGYLDC